MEVPREMANTSFSPTADAEVEPVKDAWKAAGITIELSKRAQHRPWNFGSQGTYNTAIDSSEICNCAARGLYPYNAGRLNESAGSGIKMGTYLFMVFQSADKEAHSQDTEQV